MLFLDSHAAERCHHRRKKSIGAPLPPVKITRRTAAERMTSAQGSNAQALQHASDLCKSLPVLGR